MKKIKLFLGVLAVTLVFSITNASAKTLTEAGYWSITEDEDWTLTEDVDKQIIIDGAKVTIDLNGNDIRGYIKDIIIIQNGANVTIKGEGTIESTKHQTINVTSGSTLTLESGDIKSVETGVAIFDTSTFTMNGGTITTVDNNGIAGNGTAGRGGYTINFNGGTINANITSAGYVSCGIYHPNEGTLNITGGTINSSNGAGVVQRGGTLNVTGGIINTNGSSTGKVGDSRVVVPASAIVVDKYAGYPAMNTLVTKISKDVVLNGSAGDIETLGDGVVVEVTGGIFTEKPQEEQIPEGYNAYKVLEGENKDKYVVANEEELVNTVADAMINKEDIDDDTVALIEKTVEGKYNLLSFYDVSLITVTDNDDVVGYVTETDESVKVTLGLPTEMPKLEEGYSRKYYVIRIHNGEAEIIKDVTDNGDGTVSFKSDKFSTYAIAYVDVKEETTTKTENITNPQTGDSIISNVIIFTVSIVGTTIAIRKKELIK